MYDLKDSMLVDYVIVGQGIAGTTLAWHLMEKGVRVQVLDMEKKHTSSWAAAGLYNPVTGRKMVKTWMADELFPYLHTFYRKIEEKCSQKFLHPTPIYRPFLSLEEQNDWHLRANNKAFAHFVENVATESMFPATVHDPWGGILLKNCGYLDTVAYLEASRQYFKSQQVYSKASFDQNKLVTGKDYISYGGHHAKALVFCEGPDVTTNPYFNWLPFSLVKGEILTVKPERVHEVVFNRGIFVLPLGDKSRVGSTYEHQNLNTLPTEKARTYLAEKFDKLCKFSTRVIEQRAGIRPATRDRKPFVGQHPEVSPVFIFNGMGTKGVTLAPFFAHQFTHHLLENQPLEDAVNIERFYHLYNSVLT